MSDTLRSLFEGNSSPSKETSKPETTPTPQSTETPPTAPKKEPLVCPTCGKEYKTKGAYGKHILMCKGKEECKSSCEHKKTKEKDGDEICLDCGEVIAHGGGQSGEETVIVTGKVTGDVKIKPPEKKPDNKEEIAKAQTVDEAVKIFHEEPAVRDKMRMEKMVENLWHIYGKEGSEEFSDKATHFMGQIKDLFAFSQYDPKDLETLIKIMPEDTREALKKSKERMSEYMQFQGGSPDHIVTMRKVMIGWKTRCGELVAKYKPLTLAYELGYYSLRGTAFVALTHVGRNLERNIKEATTVKDREQQSQIMTLGISKERVYYDWVVEVLLQNQRGLADMIDNMQHELIELRHQRRTEAVRQQ